MAMAEEPKNEDFLDFILQPFRQWIDFLRPNAVRYYIGLLKISLTSLAAIIGVSLVFLLVGVGLVLAAGGYTALTDASALADLFLKNLLFTGIMVLLFIVWWILVSWIGSSISLTSYVYTDHEFNNKPFSVFRSFDIIKGRVFWYLVTNFFIWLLIFLPLIVLFLLFGLGSLSLVGESAMDGSSLDYTSLLVGLAAFMFGLLIATIYIFIAGIAYNFLTQFWLYGFLIEDRGVIDSLKRNFSLIRRNIFRVLAFDFIWLIGYIAFSVPLVIYNSVSGFILEFLEALSASGELLIVATYILAMIIDMALTLLLSTLLLAYYLPTHYLFWKKVREADR